jgi:hypothetical protein
MVLVTHIGPFAEHYQHRRLNQTITMTKNPPAKRTAKKKQVTPTEHNDSNGYKLWLRQALDNDANPSVYHTIKDWTGLPADHRASFTAAVRAFWDAKNDEVSAYIQLRDAVSGVPAPKQVKDVQQVTRKILRAAKGHRDGLAKALQVCHAAMQSTLLHLDDLDTALATRPEGGLEERLHAFQWQLRKLSDKKRGNIDGWMGVSQIFDGEMTDDSIEDLKQFAELISNGLPKLNSSSISASDNDISSNKRKRLEEAEGGNSKAQRKSAASNGLRGKSVQAGAAQPQQPFAEGERLDEVEEAISKPVPVFKAINKPQGRDIQPSGSPENRGGVQPDGPVAQPVASLEPLPFPAAGMMGHSTDSLNRYHLEGGLQPSFVSWCRRQLANAAYATLEEAEPLCVALVLL